MGRRKYETYETARFSGPVFNNLTVSFRNFRQFLMLVERLLAGFSEPGLARTFALASLSPGRGLKKLALSPQSQSHRPQPAYRLLLSHTEYTTITTSETTLTSIDNSLASDDNFRE
jgi:hypothetical protein